MKKKASAEATVRNIRRKTRRKYSAEEKTRIVLEGLRGDHSVAELCRREGISENLYYRWSKDFLEAGKSRLVGDTKRQTSSNEVQAMKQENEQLPGLSARTGKQLVAELVLKNKVLKKSLLGMESLWDT